MKSDDRKPLPPAGLVSETRAIVDRVKAGDRRRFGELFDRVAPALHTWIGLRMPPKLRASVEAEDVVQEVWCRALARFEGFDPARSRFRSWVFGIAKNVMLEVFKVLRSRPAARGEGAAESSVFRLDDMPVEATGVSQRVARDLQLRAFAKRIAALREDERELLILRGLEGLPHDQIAVHIGVSAETAQKRWVRLRDRLREEGLPEDVIEA